MAQKQVSVYYIAQKIANYIARKTILLGLMMTITITRIIIVPLLYYRQHLQRKRGTFCLNYDVHS